MSRQRDTDEFQAEAVEQVAAAMMALAGAAQAALVSLGGGTVKDTSTNLIRLQTWSADGDRDWNT